MKLFKLLLLGNLGLFSFVSCEDKVTSANDLFGLTIKDAKKTYTPNDGFSVSITNKKNSPIDSVVYYMNAEKIISSKDLSEKTINLKNQKLGNRSLIAKVYSEGTPELEIKKAFDINLHGPINVIKSVLPQMRKQKSGLIINVTSIAGYMGLPYRGIYSATKAALEITAEAFRIEVKQFGIKMTNIAPGDFATNIAAGRYHAPVLENSPYKDAYSNTLEMMNAHVNQGLSLIHI